MEARWIIVRDRQARLLAEAEAERLARLIRESAAAERVDHSADPSADPSPAVLAAARIELGRRLIAVGDALAARAAASRHVTSERNCSPETC